VITYYLDNTDLVLVDHQLELMTGIIRLNQNGMMVADASSLIGEIFADNRSPEAMNVYNALNTDWSTPLGLATKPLN